MVVHAFAEIQQAFPEASLDLVGGGPLEGEIRLLAKQLGIAGINFVGVSGIKSDNIMSAPTFLECFPTG